jgi:hypothetical protein
VSQEEAARYVATLQRTINCLSDAERSTRRSAASSLATKLLRGDGATPKASPALLQVCAARGDVAFRVLHVGSARQAQQRSGRQPQPCALLRPCARPAAVHQALLSGPLLQPLATLLCDPMESCRAAALQLLLDAAPHLSGAPGGRNADCQLS